jgi:hypothetical protein
MNLYEINGSILQLAEMLESGEIDETVYNDTIESLGAEIAVEDVVKAIRNKQAEAEAIKVEADKLTDKRRRAEAAAEGLKKILLTYLTATQQKKVSAGVFSISRGASKSVEILDETAIPESYLIAQPPKVDKKAILAKLKEGEAIEGAQLKESEYVTIK